MKKKTSLEIAMRKWFRKLKGEPLEQEEQIEIDSLVEKERWEELFILSEYEPYYWSDCESLPATNKIVEILDKYNIRYLNKLEAIHFAQYWEREDITEFKVPSNIKVIYNCAFYKCKNLEHIELPDTLEDIYIDAFRGCEKLKSITLPKGLKSLGAHGDWFNDHNVFSGCKNLTDIYYEGTKEDWNDINKESFVWDNSEDCHWYDHSAIKTIHCVDGDIEL